MSGIEALLKKGFKLISNEGDNFVLKAPEEFATKFGKEISIPKTSLEGGLGSVMVKETPKSSGFGDVFSSIKEKNQVADQLDTFKKESSLDSLDKIRQDKEGLAEKSRMKFAAGGLALPTASTEVDMSPLGDLKAGYNKYKELKDKFWGTAADQMDLTKDKSASEGIKSILSNVGDPLNYIPGAPGIVGGALQMGLEALPNKEQPSKLEELLKKHKAANGNGFGYEG